MIEDDTLQQIAAEELHIPTLDTRHSDALDFHEVHVAGLQAALTRAYEAGAQAMLDAFEQGAQARQRSTAVPPADASCHVRFGDAVYGPPFAAEDIEHVYPDGTPLVEVRYDDGDAHITVAPPHVLAAFAGSGPAAGPSPT